MQPPGRLQQCSRSSELLLNCWANIYIKFCNISVMQQFIYLYKVTRQLGNVCKLFRCWARPLVKLKGRYIMLSWLNCLQTTIYIPSIGLPQAIVFYCMRWFRVPETVLIYIALCGKSEQNVAEIGRKPVGCHQCFRHNSTGYAI